MSSIQELMEGLGFQTLFSTLVKVNFISLCLFTANSQGGGATIPFPWLNKFWAAVVSFAGPLLLCLLHLCFPYVSDKLADGRLCMWVWVFLADLLFMVTSVLSVFGIVTAAWHFMSRDRRED